jgi:hypothetical protein
MTCATAHLRGDLLRQHPRGRAREIDLASLRAHQSVHERFPAGDGLDLVEEAVDGLRVFLFRIDRIVGLGDQSEIVVPQAVEAIVEEVQVQDVLPGDPALNEPLDQLEEVGRLAASPHPDTDGRLAPCRLDPQSPRHARLDAHFLEVQDDGFDGLDHRANLVTNITDIASIR